MDKTDAYYVKSYVCKLNKGGYNLVANKNTYKCP